MVNDDDDDDLTPFSLQPEAPKEPRPKPPPSTEETEDDAAGYDMAPMPETPEEVAEKVVRGKRERSLLKEDVPPAKFTLQQGWLDEVFSSSFLPLTLAFTFFFWPIMLPLAILGAISAFDSDSRRNAYVTIGFCFLPMLVLGCIYCMVSSLSK
jgi:hypothetical protein